MIIAVALELLEILSIAYKQTEEWEILGMLIQKKLFISLFGTGVNETFIRDILDRHQDPGVSKIVKLARFHGVPPSWFFTEGDDHPIDEDRERIIRLIESLPQEDRAEVEKIGLGFLLRHLRRDEALQDLPAKVNK